MVIFFKTVILIQIIILYTLRFVLFDDAGWREGFECICSYSDDFSMFAVLPTSFILGGHLVQVRTHYFLIFSNFDMDDIGLLIKLSIWNEDIAENVLFKKRKFVCCFSATILRKTKFQIKFK